MKLSEKQKVDIDIFYSELQKQFPQSELKEKNIFAEILEIPNYKIFDIVNEDGVNCGYFTFLELPNNTILIDYIAIFNEFHSKGYGSKTFDCMKNELNYLGCYLEVEKENPQDINTIRRINFYKKLGAKLLDINYIYPNIEGGLPMDLYFMSFKQNYFPKKDEILANIEFVFQELHFDIPKNTEIFNRITAS